MHLLPVFQLSRKNKSQTKSVLFTNVYIFVAPFIVLQRTRYIVQDARKETFRSSCV